MGATTLIRLQNKEARRLGFVKLARLRDRPEFMEQAAVWFGRQWNVPAETYKMSIQNCIAGNVPLPQWYLILNLNGEIIGGAGIVERSFQDRKEPMPCLESLFVEERYRKFGIATYMLYIVRKDAGKLGLPFLYLKTGSSRFYEKHGWSFIAAIGNGESLYSAPTLS